MKKMILFLLSIVCTVFAFAGTDTLTACGVPGFINDRMARWVEDAYSWMETVPSLTDLPEL